MSKRKQKNRPLASQKNRPLASQNTFQQKGNLSMCNIKVTLAYDGTNYYGFQEQRGTPYQTIQGVVEDRLSRLAKRQIRVIGAGRTDTGVHARGQVVNFDAGSWKIGAERVAYALRSLLPEDIVALESVEVDPAFHARFSAVSKSYRYTIYNGKYPSPFLRLFSYYVPSPLDDGAMREGAKYLLGRHDFSAFRALGTPVKSTVRTILESRVNRVGDLIYIDVRGDGFLYHMVRMIAGTLIRVGKGKIPPGEVEDILFEGDSLRGGPTAPARGLCLEKVEYQT
ncbi:tRNA pseudouridine(38-40) synthase TruA [Pelotomaculum sp. FP]|uniref:tRNA pseudouridine(38-40) synthase TruA n=1 Tax=Pelotomaculum sp. FP TaxID=261474 RepID=UPI0032B76A92